MKKYLHYAVPNMDYQEYLSEKRKGSTFGKIFWLAPLFPFWLLYNQMFLELVLFLCYVYIVFIGGIILANVNVLLGASFILSAVMLSVLFFFFFAYKVYEWKCERVFLKYQYREVSLNLLKPLPTIVFYILLAIIIYFPLKVFFL